MVRTILTCFSGLLAFTIATSPLANAQNFPQLPRSCAERASDFLKEPKTDAGEYLVAIDKDTVSETSYWESLDDFLKTTEAIESLQDAFEPVDSFKLTERRWRYNNKLGRLLTESIDYLNNTADEFYGALVAQSAHGSTTSLRHTVLCITGSCPAGSDCQAVPFSKARGKLNEGIRKQRRLLRKGLDLAKRAEARPSIIRKAERSFASAVVRSKLRVRALQRLNLRIIRLPLSEAIVAPEVTPTPENLPKCFASGCSGQVGADFDASGTCEWRDEFSCLRSATCERQADGQCGWTQTEELQQCLAGVRQISEEHSQS